MGDITENSRWLRGMYRSRWKMASEWCTELERLFSARLQQEPPVIAAKCMCTCGGSHREMRIK